MHLHPARPAAPWSLVPSVKSHNSPDLCSLCKARDWYIVAVVGVETRWEWQTLSLMVIDADGASECCGESTPCLIYVWGSPCLALLGERTRRVDAWMHAVGCSEVLKRCWQKQSSHLGSGILKCSSSVRRFSIWEMILLRSKWKWWVVHCIKKIAK